MNLLSITPCLIAGRVAVPQSGHAEGWLRIWRFNG
jgi:hypothetical protein